MATTIPAPNLVAVDVDGTMAGVPALLVERLPGRPPSDAAVRSPVVLRGLGETLAAIHRAGAPGQPLSGLAEAVPPYVPFGELAAERPPIASRRPKLWEDARAGAAAAPPDGRQTLIHRDFHAGNTLWLGGRLTGVVDWTSASWGMPAADLAHLRVDLVSRVGRDAADAVRAAFAGAGGDLSGARHHDLRTVFDYLTGGTEQLAGPELERFEEFLDRVL